MCPNACPGCGCAAAAFTASGGGAVQGDDAAGEVAPLRALPAGLARSGRRGRAGRARRGSTRRGRRRRPGRRRPRGRSAGSAFMRYSTYTVRNGAQVGWLNSQTTSRPPGRVTRRSSRSPASGSTMLRSPNEIVTASKVSSANGSRVPSPAVNGRCGRGLLADPEHAEREVARARRSRRASANGWLEVPVPAARSRTRSPGCGSTASITSLAPAPVLAEREHVVGHVVALRDRVEHPAYVGRLLVEVCAGHAHEGRARFCRHPVQVR